MTRKVWRFLGRLNLRSIYYNFRMLPFAQAVQLPILISNHALIKSMHGHIILEGPLKPGLLKFGYGETSIFDGRRNRMICDIQGTLIIRGLTEFGPGAKLSIGEKGIVTIGADFKNSADGAIICRERIDIGREFVLSWETLIMDTDFHQIKDDGGVVINPNRPIVIGDGVWIGCRVTILKGSVIPNGCVIGAGSLVNKELPSANALFVGNPVKLVKENIRWVP